MPPIDYAYPVKHARMVAVRDALNGGSIVLLTNESVVIGVLTLERESGMALSGLLVLAGFPKFCVAVQDGKVTRAELRNKLQELVASGLTVGVEGEQADILVNNADVKAGNLIKIDGAELRHA
tara:strand:- start:220 stop:588 length:369 start_codon:yes stop_codon:yes gene_type:complete